MIPPSGWWYPLGAGSGRYAEIECVGCGWIWNVEGRYEEGRWVSERDEDLECPVCLEHVDR